MAIAPVIPSNKYTFALGKQSAFGTPVANPDYQIPVYDADVGPDENRSELALIEGQAFLPGEYKTGGFSSGTIEWASHPDSTPRLLAAHFGTASDTVTGAGDPRSHTFARKDTPLPHTLWVGRPVAGGTFEYDKLVDVIATGLEFRYTGGQLFRIYTTLLGGSSVGVATAPTPTNTVIIPNAGNFGHTWARAALKLDVDATPATTVITNLTDFNISCSYGSAEMMWTQNFGPDFYSQGLWTLGFSATFIVANWQAYNATFYGSKTPGANTAQSSNALAGSLDFTIDQEPTSANRTIQIQIPYAQFKLARPTPNADGSGLTASLAGVLSQPASGEPITVVCKTAVSTSYS